MELIELLERGEVERFNQARPERGRLDFFAVDLAGASLAGVDLSGANLEKADLSGADLREANLMGADLSGADLTGAKLQGANGMRSRWRDAYLGEADLTEANLSNADLSDADLTSANLTKANLTSARLKNATLQEATLTGADLTEAYLEGASLRGAELSGVNLQTARLSRADLTGARLGGADLSSAQLDAAVLREADLSRAQVRGANLCGADLTGAGLDGANLTRADLTEAVLDGTDLSLAVLTDAEVGDAVRASISAEPPPPAKLMIEDPDLAICGDTLAVLWENLEPGGARLRVAVQPASGPSLSSSPAPAPVALPAPTDLVLARALAARANDFVALTLLERPSGVVAAFTILSRQGEVLERRTVKLGYTPMVRPILQRDGDQLLMFGIAREGPTLVVQRLGAEDLELQLQKPMSTVRGFVSARYPVILSKGGVVYRLESNRLGEPMSGAAGFPGRAAASCTTAEGVGLAWAERERAGVQVALLRPNQPPLERRLLPKKHAGSIDIASDAQGALVAWTTEEISPGVPASAWAARLPDGEPFAIPTDQDIDSVRLLPAGNGLAIALSTLEGGLLVYRLEGNKPTLRWRIGE